MDASKTLCNKDMMKGCMKCSHLILKDEIVRKGKAFSPYQNVRTKPLKAWHDVIDLKYIIHLMIF